MGIIGSGVRAGEHWEPQWCVKFYIVENGEMCVSASGSWMTGADDE
jgi:hypothetical protein